MGPWLVVGAISVAALAVTITALLTGGAVERRGPAEPDWLLPSPVEARRVRFPLAFRGYDPDHVDLHLDALATAYEELYLAAGPRAVARARDRLALRLGAALRPAEPSDREAYASGVPPPVRPAPPGWDGTPEELR